MKAIVQLAYGSPDVLEFRDIDKPMIGDREYQYAFRRLASIEGTGS